MYLQAAWVAATLLPLPGMMTAWRQMAGLQTPGRQIAGFQTAWRLMAGLQTPGRQMAGLQTPGRQMPGLQTPGRLMAGLQIACVQRRVADLENLLILLKVFEALHQQGEFSLVVC